MRKIKSFVSKFAEIVFHAFHRNANSSDRTSPRDFATITQSQYFFIITIFSNTALEIAQYSRQNRLRLWAEYSYFSLLASRR